jgi:hypothetical protein
MVDFKSSFQAESCQITDIRGCYRLAFGDFRRYDGTGNISVDFWNKTY